MKCNEVKEVITIFLEGELEKETSEALKAHIDSCENCKSLMEDSIKILRSLRSIEPLPVPERVVDGIIKATSKKRKGFLFSPFLQPQWVFAFSVFVLSFFFFTYPKKALFLDSIEFKTHRTYSRVVKVLSSFDEVLDYVKELKFKLISKEKERGEIKGERIGGEKILLERDIKNLKLLLF